MSETFKNLLRDTGTTPTNELQRESAVCAALTLINSKVGNTPSNSSALKDEMSKLSEYADQIQAALRVK